MSAQPPPPPDDGWPAPEGETVVRATEDTAVRPAPVGPPPDGPDRRIGWGLLFGILVVALAAGAIVAAWLLTRDDEKTTTTTVVTTTPTTASASKVAVPRLVGLKEQQALVRLGELGLRPKEVFKPTKKPTRVVVSQNPEEGTEVKKKTQVTLVIDSGAPKVAVPDVVGQPLEEATAKLDALGLDSEQTEVTSTEPPRTVVDQAPAAGTKVAKGAVVTLSVAKASGATTTTATTTGAGTTTTAAPRTVSVPDLTGMQVQPAAARLGSAGLLASIHYIPGDDPLGTVEEQSPKPGQTVKQRSRVTLNLSSGPGTKPQKTVPNVVGQTLDASVARIKAAGLRTFFLKVPVTDRAQAGKVVEQTPAAGQTAPQNAQVLIYLGAFRG
ncbi:MAG TPA: PASTA domain-containing protein [Gaiellaceae bacterium]|jgi:serine/threonine-protein kinase